MRLIRILSLSIIVILLAGCTATTSAPPPVHKSTPEAKPAPRPAAPETAPEAVPAPKPAVPAAFDSPPTAGTRARCPVAGEVFTVSEPAARFEHEGKHYVVCCAGCLPPLRKDPSRYLGR